MNSKGDKLARKVGIRQLQKKAKRESDVALENVTESDDWLSKSGCRVFGESTSSTRSMGTDNEDPPVAHSELLLDSAQVERDSVASRDCSVASSDSAPSRCHSPDVIIGPTRLSEIFSDYDSSSSEEIELETDDLCARLQRWYVTSKINLNQLGTLLTELRTYHPELPKDARTLVKTPRFTAVEELNNGIYVHIGLEKGLLSRLKSGTVETLSRCLRVDVNMDGLQLSKSSNIEAWPILARCKDLCDHKPFSVGFFCGSSKPDPLESYLDNYIKEVQKLAADGILFNGQKFQVYIESYTCDAPARAYLKCIKGHSGYSGCERCIQEGDHDGDRMIYEGTKSALRTDESFQRQDDEGHHKGVSPLLELHTRMVTMFPLDPLHLLLHGVLKRFLQYLLGKCRTNAKLSAAKILQVSTNLVSLDRYIPREFSRIPRSLTFVARWKATELRLFLLYTGIIAVKNAVPDEIYSMFLLLHVVSRIISYPELVKNPTYVDYAENLFSTFVNHCADRTVFGPTFIVYKVHSLLHLCDDVRRFGVITNFSTFPFENHLGIIKRMVRSGVRIPQQIARRLTEMDGVTEEVPRSKPTSLSPDGYVEASAEYKSLSCVDFTLTPCSSKGSFFKMGESIGHIKKIKKTPHGVSVIAVICEELLDFYTYPMESHKVGVYKFEEWTARDVSLDVSCITGKFMVLPWKNERVAIHMLHTS